MVNMKVIEFNLKGVYIINNYPHNDERGSFTRLFCKEKFEESGLITEYVQVNHSFTKNKGSIRGLHIQKPPKTEAKLIKCIAGKVYDVFVDLRKNSETFLEWSKIELSEDKNTMIYIPEGFAHGFQTLEDNSQLIYFHSQHYSPEFELGIRYNDTKINIEWPLKTTCISKKDESYSNLDDLFSGIEI